MALIEKWCQRNITFILALETLKHVKKLYIFLQFRRASSLFDDELRHKAALKYSHTHKTANNGPVYGQFQLVLIQYPSRWLVNPNPSHRTTGCKPFRSSGQFAFDNRWKFPEFHVISFSQKHVLLQRTFTYRY